MQKKKIIAVNARFLIKNKLEGIGYFTFETLRYITAAHPEIEFHFLFDRPYDPTFIFSENIKPVVLFPPARHPFLWYWWFEISVKNYLKKTKPDLFLSPDGYVSLGSKTPTVAVQHDIAFVHFPTSIPKITNWYYQYFVPKFLNRADRIATVSSYSKNDIIEQYRISPEKIDVVYSASKDFFAPINETEKNAIREKHSDGNAYFVYVGAVHPRKNVLNMLKAFEQFKIATNSAIQFLLIGGMGWQNEALNTFYENMQHKNTVKFLGRMEEKEMVKIIGGSIGLCYVSLFEGFGVPPLEGMACGVPVISSAVTSIPEVCGDAALLVNPEDISAISTAMQQIATDENLRQNLIEKGFERIKFFTWQKTAQLLWQSCEKVIENKKPR